MDGSNPLFAPVIWFIAIATWLPLTWRFFLLEPFTGFTFTDAPDFIFATLIFLTFAALLVCHFKKPYPAFWVRYAPKLCLALAIITPLVPLTAIYLVSWRAQTILGHWPQEMINDPKWIGPNDHLYEGLRHSVGYCSAFAGWGLYTWLGLLAHLWHHLSAKQKRWQLGVFLSAWIMFHCEPGGRYWWWLD